MPSLSIRKVTPRMGLPFSSRIAALMWLVLCSSILVDLRATSAKSNSGSGATVLVVDVVTVKVSVGLGTGVGVSKTRVGGKGNGICGVLLGSLVV